MESAKTKARVAWYRSPVSREQLRELNQRSDFKGSLQTMAFLGLLFLTGSAAYLSACRLKWPLAVLLFFIHGTCWAFIVDACHEFTHESVFKTRFLNKFFGRIFSFLAWDNPYRFWASHMEHHKYTLHPPDDLEVVLPLPLSLKGFLMGGFINPQAAWATFNATVYLALGKLQGTWEKSLFPATDTEQRRRLFNWARFLLAGQAAIVATAFIMHWWLLIFVVTLAPFYGEWLRFLCNQTQHGGLQDNVPDYRLCCRTMIVNPFLQFLYWHMNFHTEHHMYAGVPCYNLGKLHAIIASDLPPCPRGLTATWIQLIGILRQQKRDPSYKYSPSLPSPGVRKLPATPAAQVVTGSEPTVPAI